MLDEKLRSELEQSTATLVELFPPLWRQLFQALLREGFKYNEAMDLLKTYILSQGTAPTVPPKT